ncbi:hypothetical protein LCGC14_0598920 [marine sediment metagenome]|uniref:Ribbon-helix-helix protein CopG domain-containing protein n=1 Tax=marine sediment metagenome TaxID=412755 RepID=A0A0F9RG57_9ZZZZ
MLNSVIMLVDFTIKEINDEVNYYIIVNLTVEQIKRLKIMAIKEEKTIKQLVKELIVKKLEKVQPKEEDK